MNLLLAKNIWLRLRAFAPHLSALGLVLTIFAGATGTKWT
jgi:hypothetical protein